MIAEHYRLVERIGSGGTGVVWRAVDERLQRSVAIKQIHIKPSLPQHEREVVRQRAFREARNAARFQHPNAIVVFDITEHNGDPCLVMEYLKSRSLAAVISAQGTLPLTQVARIGEQVAAALIAAHQAGIVHRDVKPGNVLLDDHGTVKITDFGISRATGDVTLTETGLICGTAAYLAPEVARGADPTPSADVFALGATLFHALEGEPPYGASANPLAVLYAAANGQVSEPRNAGPATDFLLQLLDPDPEQRPTMRTSRARLAALAETGAEPVPAGFVPASEAYGAREQQRGGPGVRTASPPPQRHSRPTSPRPGGPGGPGGPRNGAAPRGANHPKTATHPRTAAHPQPAPDAGSGSGKRTAVVIGAGLGAIAAVAAVLFTTMGGDDSTGNQAAASTTSVSVSAGPATSSAALAAIGQTPSAATVDLGSAAQLVVDFYSSPAGNWSLLTPAAQEVYGSESEFRQYWRSRTIDTFSSIDAPSRSNNDDGSITMRVASLTISGQTKAVTLRVIGSGSGRLLIDSDTR
ncbi:protein kinase [Nocardia sp. NPDC057353]|uniref:serine/threonine-protein kinase n=1 Tax=Nocardia sp. NPDC057353 TaxID=3346104 RepID=UPI00362A80A5